MSHVRYRSHDAADTAPPRANLRQLVARTTTESRTFSVGQPTPLRRLSATPGEPATTRRQNDDRTSHVRCRSTDSADSAPPPANLRHLVARTTTESRTFDGGQPTQAPPQANLRQLVDGTTTRSEEHTSDRQSLMSI